jgi:chorismate synthase
MSGNTFGRLFTVTTFGESHGPGLGCIVDGCPPGLALDEEDIQRDVERRRSGKSRHVSQRREPDQVRIMSGVFEGLTTGAPIGLVVENLDAKPKDYAKIAELFRPGHADYTWARKYGIRDHRGGGRSSARETVMRVAAGAIARKYLATRLGIEIRGWLAQLGPIRLEPVDLERSTTTRSSARTRRASPELEAYMDRLRKSGDSIGARVNVIATGVPPGLGEPVFDKLDADIAHAMMGINAVKAWRSATASRWSSRGARSTATR